jgi:CDP-glucose 4,6-dehydratase
MEDMVNRKLFGGTYQGRTVLVTGDTGFKGSWLCLWLTMMGADVIGYSDRIPSKPAHFTILKPAYKSYRGDICDTAKLASVIKRHKPEIVFHMAAQSLVRFSYENPIETYRVNVLGSLSLLEAIRSSDSVKCLVNVTTDKVYENEEIPKAYVETDRLGGYDPYSSSKACVEVLSDSYRRSFFDNSKLLMANARAGNVIGGGDWAADRLVPDIMRATRKKQTVIIRNPSSIRPWQHVLEPLSGYLLLGQKLLEGQSSCAGAWNFGPDEDQCVAVLDVVKALKKSWPAIQPEFVSDLNVKYHEAKILMLSYEKARTQLGWQPIWKMSTTVRYTANWYKLFYETGVTEAATQIERFVRDAKKINVIWTK